MNNGAKRAIRVRNSVLIGIAATTWVLAGFGVAYAYSIYPSPAAGDSTTMPSMSSSTDFMNSMNQFVVPFENFVNSIQLIQPSNVPNFSNVTNQLPPGTSPTLQGIIVKTLQWFAWLIGLLEAVSNWIANWVISIIR